MSSKFLYFGFGSNMLQSRIRIQNPTAERVGPGILKNYCLDFNTISKNWKGAPATIVMVENAIVRGAIWEIECCNLKDLDNQEGVDRGVYIPIMVPVYCLSLQKTLNCRTYHLCDQPLININTYRKDCVPYNRQPSKTYLKTMVKGAVETGLPSEYINYLKSFKHNGESVDILEQQLDLANVIL